MDEWIERDRERVCVYPNPQKLCFSFLKLKIYLFTYIRGGKEGERVFS